MRSRSALPIAILQSSAGNIFAEEEATLDGRTFDEVKDARYNENVDRAGSAQEGPNADEDIGADVSA
jgi:hypothetical protein